MRGAEMSLDILLSRLERVRKTGPGRWIASCPCREDKRPSMTIRELDDGRVLIHDFGGSSPEEILGAIGLTFSDLFPDRLSTHGKPERRPFPAADLLRVIGFEALLVALAAANLAGGALLDGADRARLMLAASRIREALNAGGISYE